MPRGLTRLWRPVAAVLAATALFPAAAAAAGPSGVALWSRFSPVALGAPTAVTFGFRVEGPAAAATAPPLGSFSVSLPAGMGFAASGLGLATCSPRRLLSAGAAACPHESLIGEGRARVVAPFGARGVTERAHVLIFIGQPVEEQTTVLVYFDGRQPVLAPLVLLSQVTSSASGSRSVLRTTVPAIATVPEGADVALTELQATLGPPGLRYVKREGGRRVRYRPAGLSVPGHCPVGGFRFDAAFQFTDGSSATSSSTVPCPPVGGGNGGAR
jgi:hypothetical protein